LFVQAGGGAADGIEVALDPSELELDPAAMQARLVITPNSSKTYMYHTMHGSQSLGMEGGIREIGSRIGVRILDNILGKHG
jgi:hypothetical protein